MQSAFQYILKVSTRVRGLYRPLRFFHLGEIMFLWLLLCSHEHCNAGTGLGILLPVKGNCKPTAHKDILDNYVLSTLCQ